MMISSHPATDGVFMVPLPRHLAYAGPLQMFIKERRRRILWIKSGAFGQQDIPHRGTALSCCTIGALRHHADIRTAACDLEQKTTDLFHLLETIIMSYVNSENTRLDGKEKRLNDDPSTPDPDQLTRSRIIPRAFWELARLHTKEGRVARHGACR